MDPVAELNSEDTKRNKFHVFKNVSFDSRAIAVILGIAYFVMIRNTRLSLLLYSSEVLLFGDIDLHKKPVFGSRKYNTSKNGGGIFKSNSVSRDWGEVSLLY